MPRKWTCDLSRSWCAEISTSSHRRAASEIHHHPYPHATMAVTPPPYPRKPRRILLDSAILALEDGTVFEGRSFGAPAERSGEVVFNTALTGYQEVFTDPSYSGQIVILTNPQIGNYGTSSEDSESAKPYIEGLVVREFAHHSSNWRSDQEADSFLARNRIPIVSEI